MNNREKNLSTFQVTDQEQIVATNHTVVTPMKKGDDVSDIPNTNSSVKRRIGDDIHDNDEPDKASAYQVSILPTPIRKKRISGSSPISVSHFKDEISYIIMKRTGLVAVYFTSTYSKTAGQSSFVGHFRKLVKEPGFNGNLDPSLKLRDCSNFPLFYGPYSQVDFESRQPIREANHTKPEESYPATMFILVPKLEVNGNVSAQSVEEDLAYVAKVSEMLYKSYFPASTSPPSIGLAQYANQTKKKHGSATLDRFMTEKMVVGFVGDHFKEDQEFYSKYNEYAMHLFEDPTSSYFAKTALGYPDHNN